MEEACRTASAVERETIPYGSKMLVQILSVNSATNFNRITLRSKLLGLGANRFYSQSMTLIRSGLD